MRVQTVMQKYETYYISAEQGRIFRKTLEWIGAMAAVILGVQFMVNGFKPYVSIYLPMSIAATALQWGMMMIMLGTIRIVILVVNGWWPYTYQARKWLSASFIMLVWVPMASCYWWNFIFDVSQGDMKTYPGLAYSVLSVGAELLIFYAHASFVYINKRGSDG